VTRRRQYTHTHARALALAQIIPNPLAAPPRPPDQTRHRNERGYDASWIVRLRAALDGAGFLATRIAASDSDWSIVNDMATNPALYAAVDVVGVHYPGTPPAAAYALNKTLWASEMWNLGQVDDYQGAAYLASDLANHASWGLSASIAWCLIYSWYANLNYGRVVAGSNSGAGHSLMTAAEPWSGYYEANPTLAVMAHWTQFAQPGWRFLRPGGGIGTLPGGGSFTTLFNEHVPAAQLEFSVVISTMQGASQPQTVTFAIAGLSAGRALPAALHAWQTQEGSLFQPQADVPVGADGTFTVTIPTGAMLSVTTTVGQGFVRPAAPIPPSQPFPFPYSESFNAYPQQTTARYWSSMGGGWLAMPLPAGLLDAKSKAFPDAPSPSNGETDSAYLQVVPANPGPNGWATSPNPCTVVGNPNGGVANVASWTDYVVTAKGLIDASADPSGNGNNGKLAVTNQQACAAGKPEQSWTLLGGDLVTTPARIQSGTGGGCLALFGADPDFSGAMRLGLAANCSLAPLFKMDSATQQISTLDGQCIDVWSQSKSPGQRVITWPCETPPGANEQWQVKPAGPGGAVTLVAAFDSLCLDLVVITPPETVFLWIAGRVQTFGWDATPQGYVLTVYASPNSTVAGTFTLDSHTTVLASGSTPTPINVGEWHELQLAMKGSSIVASLDGAALATISDSSMQWGNIAIGSGWHTSWFDDVAVANVTTDAV